MPGALGIGLGIPTAANGGMNVVPGGTPQNGMIGSQFFKDGSEVAPTGFFSSAYDSQYHTPEGIVMDEPDGQYTPQLSDELVALFNAPCTIVFDASYTDHEGVTSGNVLLNSDTPWFNIEASANGGVSDDSVTLGDEIANGPFGQASGRFRFAVTRLDGQLLVSVNGGAMLTQTGTAEFSWGDLTLVTLQVRYSGSTIHEFTIYTDPVTDGTELQTLSSL